MEFSNIRKLIFFISFVILSTALIYQHFELIRQWNKENIVLFIAIPSSPEHFEHRESLRETWLQSVPKVLKYKFIVGSSMCNIHPENRRSEYLCESLNISLPKHVQENTDLQVNSLRTEAKPVQPSRGFIFTVHHPVIIKTLGIQRSALASEKEKIIRIALHYISQNNFNLNLTHPATKIASVTFQGDLIRDDENNRGYVYKKLSNPLHLAQGFEGMVLVEKGSIQDDYFDCEQSTIWKHGNLFTISNVVTKSSIEVSVEKYCVLSSFGFTIKDIPGLEKRINKTKERTEDWNKYVEKVYTQLQRESVEHGDILFLDMVDVYRNLPQKMFLFYKWLFKNYNVNYVLKTDDDVFVDILKVQREIEKQIQWDWWSCFRIDWPVKRGGKWQETFNYKEEIYPPFPTGAGYVLSEKALDWLRYRLDTLSVEYQGEDVAMGIWLEGLEPTRHTGDACYWACVDQCHAHSCNTIQLSVADMYSVWNSYQECGQMCGCSALS